jgi:hypothetical protein
MINYIFAFLLFLLIFILISHHINNKRINTELQIQQTEHPDVNMISVLYNKKLPTVYLYELELWEGFDLLIGEEYETIKEVLDNKEAFNKLKYYLQPFNLPLTTKWDIKLHKTEIGWNNLSQQPIKERHYNHVICNFSGLMMICLFNPSKDNLEILNFDFRGDFPLIKDILSNDETAQQLEYIIIPIRPSNMIYIPYGWYYWIYNGIDNKYCCYLDCINHSIV